MSIRFQYAGKDATNDYEDVGHSDLAMDLMDKYCIGEIEMAKVQRLDRTHVPPKQAVYNQDKSPGFATRILLFLVPLIILGLAFTVRNYTTAGK